MTGYHFPFGFEYIWQYYIEVSSGRQYGASGPNPISFEAIESWSRVTKRQIKAWDVDTIKMIDGLFLKDVGERQRQQREKQKRQQNAPRG